MDPSSAQVATISDSPPEIESNQSIPAAAAMVVESVDWSKGGSQEGVGAPSSHPSVTSDPLKNAFTTIANAKTDSKRASSSQEERSSSPPFYFRRRSQSRHAQPQAVPSHCQSQLLYPEVFHNSFAVPFAVPLVKAQQQELHYFIPKPVGILELPERQVPHFTRTRPDYHPGHHLSFSRFPPPQPFLNILPEREVNFTNSTVCFEVQAWIMPPFVPLSIDMLEGVAETPSGKLLGCFVRPTQKTNMYEPDSFHCSFRTFDEIGLYILRIRLVLPCSTSSYDSNFGALGEQMPIWITRNYYKESALSNSTTSLQLEHVAKEEIQRDWERNEEDLVSSLSSAGVWGLACDKQTNRLFYTDRLDNSFSCVDPESGKVILKYNKTSPRNTNLKHPTGIAIDEANKKILIADKDHHRIVAFTMDGQFLYSFGGFGHSDGEFSYPWDVDINYSGDRIVVADSRNRRIQLFDRHGIFLAKFSVFEATPYDFKGKFEYPRGVTFNTDSTSIFVTDVNSNNIVEVPISMHTFRRVLPEKRLKLPQGITVDAYDNLLVCDTLNHNLSQVYAPTGVVVSKMFTIGSERLEGPINVTVMGHGRVAILDDGAKVQIF